MLDNHFEIKTNGRSVLMEFHCSWCVTYAHEVSVPLTLTAYYKSNMGDSLLAMQVT